MIIVCVNCAKSFNVNSELIPDEGRTIQCGSCRHVWFYKRSHENEKDKKIQYTSKEYSGNENKKNIVRKKLDYSKNKKNIYSGKRSEIIKYQPKPSLDLLKFISYFIVSIITFFAIIVILDTFQTFFFKFFPNLEFYLFSLYETLKDIELFIKDLF